MLDIVNKNSQEAYRMMLMLVLLCSLAIVRRQQCILIHMQHQHTFCPWSQWCCTKGERGGAQGAVAGIVVILNASDAKVATCLLTLCPWSIACCIIFKVCC